MASALPSGIDLGSGSKMGRGWSCLSAEAGSSQGVVLKMAPYCDSANLKMRDRWRPAETHTLGAMGLVASPRWAIVRLTQRRNRTAPGCWPAAQGRAISNLTVDKKGALSEPVGLGIVA